MKMLFTIIYRKQHKDGGYWSNDTTTVKVYGKDFEEAKSKIDKIDPCRYDIYNKVLHWEAQEILGGDVDDE